jgi:hypothetical protein
MKRIFGCEIGSRVDLRIAQCDVGPNKWGNNLDLLELCQPFNKG